MKLNLIIATAVLLVLTGLYISWKDNQFDLRVMAVTEIDNAILTAYTSEVAQTDDTPFITASGERVRDGVVANNCLKIGTVVVINGKHFIVLDRKNSRYDCRWYDIWLADKQEAIEFGIKKDQTILIWE